MPEALYLLGWVALLAGLAGAVLPIPGPPLSYAGLLLLHFSGKTPLPTGVLVAFGLATVLIAVLDYLIPIWGVRRFGGSRYGSWGSALGLLAGLLLPIPGGMLLGAFGGAFLGELLGGMATGPALRAAFGSLLGLLTGLFIKVVLCLLMLGYALKVYWPELAALE